MTGKVREQMARLRREHLDFIFKTFFFPSSVSSIEAFWENARSLLFMSPFNRNVVCSVGTVGFHALIGKLTSKWSDLKSYMSSAFFTDALCDVLDSSCDDFLLSVQFHQKTFFHQKLDFISEDIQQRSFHCFFWMPCFKDICVGNIFSFSALLSFLWSLDMFIMATKQTHC